MEQTLSEKIQQCKAGVVSNPFQGKDKKVLFVCSMGILRSATGARMYAHKYNTRAAGTHSEALIRASYSLLCWADEIVFVNKENYETVYDEFFGTDFLYEIQEKSVVLNIPDMYEHMNIKLQKAFIEQYDVVPIINKTEE